LSETFLILRRTEQDRIKNVHIGLHINHYSCLILKKFKFFERFFKNTQISNFIKIHLVGAKLFHADRWMETDMTKLTVAIENFVNVPKSTIVTHKVLIKAKNVSKKSVERKKLNICLSYKLFKMFQHEQLHCESVS
jgi:hypothetical protein